MTQPSTPHAVTTTEGPLDSRFDADAIVRAVQALSGDMALGSLVGRVLRLAAESSGVEQAALALESATLYAEARREADALRASNEQLTRQLEEHTAQLRAAKEAAESAHRSKLEFLSRMSHELRTPLNGILGYAQVLEHLPDMPEKARDGVDIIKRSAHQLLALIKAADQRARAGDAELEPVISTRFVEPTGDLSEARRASPCEPIASLPRPSSDDVAVLVNLARRGRVAAILDELNRLANVDSRFGPWLERVRALAQGLQLKLLREALEASMP